MNQFSQICREENAAIHNAALKRYVRARRLKAADEVLGCALCILCLYAFTIMLFCF